MRIPGLSLRELEIELQVESTKEAGTEGGVQFWVLAGKGSAAASKGMTQKVVLRLTVPDGVDLGTRERH